MVTPTRLGGRYLIDQQVGIGGMGSVYSATDERLGRRVAVKLLKEELASDPRFIERFRREARAAAALSHPNVAGVFDYGEDEGRPFIVMELIDGRDLSRVMREEGPLDHDRSVQIAQQIALALGHAHSAGLVHRDVKPHNVIVTDNGRVKVTDFGIARATGESTLTATGTILGTAQYLSPEQASGDNPGPPSDVYSLGIVLYEMLTGAVPFTGDSPVSVALRHVRDEVPPPSSMDRSIPSAYDDLVARATAKQPEERFADGAAFAAALNAGGTQDVPATAEMAAPGEAATTWPFAHPPRWDPQRVGRTVIAVFAVLLVIAVAALGYRLISKTESIRERNRARAAGENQPQTPTASPSPVSLTLEDYHGRPLPEVRAELSAAGLVVDPHFDECDLDEGLICEQTPAPGDSVQEGEAVTLVVSTSGDEDDEGPGVGKKDKVPPGQAKKDEEGDD